jgi:uncharacterized DUF497 family protein
MDDSNLDLTTIVGFEWDKGNINKNKDKHGVENQEAEEIFFNKPLIILEDKIHSSEQEKRWGALGQTNQGRKLAVYFTIRDNKIRVISARNQSPKDRAVYMGIEKK